MATKKTKSELEEELKAARAEVEELEEENETLKAVEAVLSEPEPEPEPEKPKGVTFKARSGYVLVGHPKFPLYTEDQELIDHIRKSRAYRGRIVWEEKRTTAELVAAEHALSGVSFTKLVKAARKHGIAFPDGMTKLDLIEAIEKAGG